MAEAEVEQIAWDKLSDLAVANGRNIKKHYYFDCDQGSDALDIYLKEAFRECK